jgi:alkylation response protein AidB-like acyl-CoA dehydrogenase
MNIPDNGTRPLTSDGLRNAVRALSERWRTTGRYTPRSDNWMRGFDPAFSKELSQLGLIGMTWPKRFGGGGFSNVERLAVTEELLRAGAPVAAHWIADRQIGPAILRHGTEDLQAELLPGITRADYVFCLGMSEPEAGSDLANVQTRAEPVAGGWRVTGRKVWTSGAHHATHMYLLARTTMGSSRHDGLTELILDMDSVGIEVSPIVDMSGEHHFNEVTFDGVQVPESRVLGNVGNGWRQVVEQLSFERGGPERFLSSYPLLASALTVAAGSVADRDLGLLVARLATLRRLCYQVAHDMDKGLAPVQQAATLKYLGNAFEQDVVEFVRERQGSAVDQSSLLGHALLTSPGYSIRGGAAEVMLSLIARQEGKS